MEKEKERKVYIGNCIVELKIKQKIPHLVEVLTFVEIYIYKENNSNASKKEWRGSPKM